MRLPARKSRLLAISGLLAFSALLPLASSAEAAGTVTVVGSAPEVATGPVMVTVSYVVTLPSAVTATSFLTHQDLTLPASTSGVSLDNAAVPAAQITRVASGDLSVQTGPTAGSGLTAGTHVLSFQAAVPAGAAVTSASTITFAYTDAGSVAHTLDSAPVRIAANQPDLAVSLTPGTGEDTGVPGRIGTGRTAQLAVDVSNSGYGLPGATLVITLPTGLGLAGTQLLDADGNPVAPCVAVPAVSGEIQCALGTLQHTTATTISSVFIPVVPTAAPLVGTTAAITVAVGVSDPSQGTDINLANNSTQFAVQFTGTAALTAVITTASPTVALGKTTTVTFTVHNSGPNLAGSTIGLAALDSPDFTLVSFSGKSIDLSGLGGVSIGSGSTTPAAKAALATPAAKAALAAKVAAAKVAAAKIVAAAHWGSPTRLTLGQRAIPAARGLVPLAAAPARAPLVFWQIGDLASGQSVSATMTLKATALGTVHAQLLAVSAAGDPNCPELTCVPRSATLTVIPAPAVARAPAKTPVAQSGAGSELANTGGSQGPAVQLAVSLMLAGAGLLLLVRRRPAAR